MKPSDAAAAALMAAVAEAMAQTCGTVSMPALLEGLSDLWGEDLVLLLARAEMLAGVIVKAAAADLQGGAEFLRGVLVRGRGAKLIDQ